MSSCYHLTDVNRDVAVVNAVTVQHDDCVKSLIQAGAYVNHTDEHSNTALNTAVLNGCDQYLRMLIKAGVNVNTRDALKVEHR